MLPAYLLRQAFLSVSRVNAGCTTSRVPGIRDVRRHRPFAQLLDEGGGVVGLVGTQRDAALSLAAVEHDKRRFPFRRAGRVGERRVDRKGVAVLR
jgi:hypothetical protein